MRTCGGWATTEEVRMQRATVYTDSKSWGGNDMLSCLARLAWLHAGVNPYIAFPVAWELRRGSVREHAAIEQGALHVVQDLGVKFLPP